MAGPPARHARRLCLSEPDRPRPPHEHAPVRPACRRVGHRHRAPAPGLRHALAAPDQSGHHLQADRQLARRADPAWAHTCVTSLTFPRQYPRGSVAKSDERWELNPSALSREIPVKGTAKGEAKVPVRLDTSKSSHTGISVGANPLK